MPRGRKPNRITEVDVSCNRCGIKYTIPDARMLQDTSVDGLNKLNCAGCPEKDLSVSFHVIGTAMTLGSQAA